MLRTFNHKERHPTVGPIEVRKNEKYTKIGPPGSGPHRVGCYAAGKMGSWICMEMVTIQGVKLDICRGESVSAGICSPFQPEELPQGEGWGGVSSGMPSGD